MQVVIDTNVLVSAMLSPNGTPAKVLSLALHGKIKVLYDNRIIFEYIDVLSRKEFGFSKEIINDMIDYFRRDGEYVNPEPIKLDFTDEKDRKFYEVYKSGEAKYLITGNIRHFPKEDAVVLPKEFIVMHEK